MRGPHPNNRRAAIPERVLRELYVEDGLSLQHIATRLRLSATSIARRFRDLRIPARRRGPRPRSTAQPDRTGTWTSEVAYSVGLITTDGCLSGDGRHLALTSRDADLLETVRRCLGIAARVTLTTNPRPCYRLQWGDVAFYRWLMSIGLMPAKSLKLGPLRVPDEWIRDFFRGCIDGDGSITTYVDRHNARKQPTYHHVRIYLSLVSASPRFVDWLRDALGRVVGVSGHVTIRRSAKHSDICCLRFAKRESLQLLRWMYSDPAAPRLGRKYDIAAPFLVRREVGHERRRGRPVVL